MKAMLQTVSLVFSLVLVSAMSACQAQADQNTSNLSPHDFAQQIKAKGDSALVVDVRTPGEFRSGHIPGAISVDYNGSHFAEEVGNLPKDKQVFIYCQSGRRSRASASVFLEAGFNPVANLANGILGWREAGLPMKVD
jgi:rhodanese-related sulfurtransferase